MIRYVTMKPTDNGEVMAVYTYQDTNDRDTVWMTFNQAVEEAVRLTKMKIDVFEYNDPVIMTISRMSEHQKQALRRLKDGEKYPAHTINTLIDEGITCWRREHWLFGDKGVYLTRLGRKVKSLI